MIDIAVTYGEAVNAVAKGNIAMSVDPNTVMAVCELAALLAGTIEGTAATLDHLRLGKVGDTLRSEALKVFATCNVQAFGIGEAAVVQ